MLQYIRIGSPSTYSIYPTNIAHCFSTRPVDEFDAAYIDSHITCTATNNAHRHCIRFWGSWYRGYIFNSKCVCVKSTISHCLCVFLYFSKFIFIFMLRTYSERYSCVTASDENRNFYSTPQTQRTTHSNKIKKIRRIISLAFGLDFFFSLQRRAISLIDFFKFLIISSSD